MPLPLHRQLSLTEDQLIAKLRCLYHDLHQSQSKIATELGCCTATVENLFQKYHIPVRAQTDKLRIAHARTCPLSPIEQEVVTGLLLSDGHIEMSTYQGRLAFTFKHREFAQHIVDCLPSLEWGSIRANPKALGWNLKSLFCQELATLHKVWYVDGRKVVPQVAITPETAYWWYLGDGYVEKKCAAATLCTDAFLPAETKRLAADLATVGLPCYVTSKNRIRVNTQSGYANFLRYIGPCRVSCYSYKWKTHPKSLS